MQPKTWRCTTCGRTILGPMLNPEGHCSACRSLHRRSFGQSGSVKLKANTSRLVSPTIGRRSARFVCGACLLCGRPGAKAARIELFCNEPDTIESKQIVYAAYVHQSCLAKQKGTLASQTARLRDRMMRELSRAILRGENMQYPNVATFVGSVADATIKFIPPRRK